MRKGADQLFREAFGGDVNFMTPNILKRGLRGGFAYELSTGTGFQNQPIWGVTLLDRRTGEHLHEQCKCFQSREAAERYIRELI